MSIIWDHLRHDNILQVYACAIPLTCRKSTTVSRVVQLISDISELEAGCNCNIKQQIRKQWHHFLNILNQIRSSSTLLSDTGRDEEIEAFRTARLLPTHGHTWSSSESDKFSMKCRFLQALCDNNFSLWLGMMISTVAIRALADDKHN